MEASASEESRGRGSAITREQLHAGWMRWRARLPRFAAMGAVVILSLVGLRELVVPEAPPQAATGGPVADAAAEDFAIQFARAYLTYDAEKPEAREAALAAFLPSELDPDGGFVPAGGSQEVLWAHVASNQRALAGGRVLTVAAQTTDHERPLYLAVTVRHESGKPLALVGYPSLVGAPAVSVETEAVDRGTVEDPQVAEVAGRVVRNYLAGEVSNLEADLSANALVTVPTIALEVTSVEQVVWTGEGPESGAVLVTVSASDASGAAYRLTYELGVVLRDRPYIDFIQVIPTDS